MTVKKNDIKKSCVDKMFTAVDRQKKIISINDTVNVLEGPFQVKPNYQSNINMFFVSFCEQHGNSCFFRFYFKGTIHLKYF